MRNLRCSLLFITGLCALSPFSLAEQVRNRYTHEMLLGSNHKTVSAGIPGADLSLSQWNIIPDKTNKLVRICMKFEVPGKCISIDNGLLSLKPSSQPSSQWFIKAPVEGTPFYRLESSTARGTFLHVEGGSLQAGPIKPGWWSAMWAIDKEPINDARSVHLAYDQVQRASDFYIEARIEESHPGTYFAAIAFDGGYFGIQELSSASCRRGKQNFNKQIIFSLWNDAEETDDKPNADSLAKVILLGENVSQRTFGGEGTGVQTYKCFEWETNQTYRFYIQSRTERRYTVYRAYFGTQTDWMFIAEAKRPAHAILISGVYSFVEDFARTGSAEGLPKEKRSPFQRRAANYMNPWQGKNQRMTPVDEARFTAWSENQPLTNITATTPPAASQKAGPVTFHLATGGKIVQQTDLNTKLKSQAHVPIAPVLPK